MTSCRVLERSYSSDVEECKDVCENIRNIPRRDVVKKLLILEFGIIIFRVCLPCVLGWVNSKSLDRLKASAIFWKTE